MDIGRKSGRRVVSARELGGVIWRLQLPEDNDRAAFETGATLVGSFLGYQKSKAQGYEAKELAQSPTSVAGHRNGYTSKLKALVGSSNFAMEGETKWNKVHVKTSDKVEHVYGHSKHPSQPICDNSAIPVIKCQIEKANERIHKLETEKRSSKKKLEHFLKKLSEERGAWRNNEHEKIRKIIVDAKADLKNERKIRQRWEIVNSKLVRELADAKLLVKRHMQDYEKERKARELTEEESDEMAKEIGKNKATVEALKRKLMKMHEEVDNERRMLQMAEVWREERVQMKLIDAKVMIEERYMYMNKLVAEVEAFLGSRSPASIREDIRKAEILQQAADLVNVQDIKEFTCEPSNPDDIISLPENVNSGDAIKRETDPCKNLFHKDTSIHRNGEVEEDGSGWETMSQVEDQGSSYSLESSDPVNNNIQKTNDKESVTKWEEHGCKGTPITDASEVCSAPKTHNKKVSAIAQLWRSGLNNGKNFKIISVDGMDGRFSGSRISDGGIVLPEQWSSL